MYKPEVKVTFDVCGKKLTREEAESVYKLLQEALGLQPVLNVAYPTVPSPWKQGSVYRDSTWTSGHTMPEKWDNSLEMS